MATITGKQKIKFYIKPLFNRTAHHIWIIVTSILHIQVIGQFEPWLPPEDETYRKNNVWTSNLSVSYSLHFLSDRDDSFPVLLQQNGGQRKTINKLYAPWALRIAAFPRPAPEPWFLFFMLFSIGAFFNISGKMRNRILLPLMYTCSSCATRPSLYVTVMLDIWKVKISQCSWRPLTVLCSYFSCP